MVSAQEALAWPLSCSSPGVTGEWMWREVVTRLRAVEHEAATPTLTSLGERVHFARPDAPEWCRDSGYRCYDRVQSRAPS